MSQYDPAAGLDTLVGAVVDAFAAKVLSAGVQSAEATEGTRVPRQLPAVQLVQTQIVRDTDHAVGFTNWHLTWRVDLYVQLKDYPTAYAELGSVVPKIVYLPVAERDPRSLTPRVILGGTCDEWDVVDEGNDPVPDDQSEILYKQLRLTATLTTSP